MAHISEAITRTLVTDLDRFCWESGEWHAIADQLQALVNWDPALRRLTPGGPIRPLG